MVDVEARVHAAELRQAYAIWLEKPAKADEQDKGGTARALLSAALGTRKRLLELSVYDGSDNGEKVYNTLTVIGQPIAGDRTVETPDPATADQAMKALTRWPVTVSYYDRSAKSDSGEQTPVYAMSFELYENGVSRSLVLDYNDFVLAGAMGKLDVKAPGKPCK